MKPTRPPVFLLCLLVSWAPSVWAADPPPIDESTLFGATVLRVIDPAKVATETVRLTGDPQPQGEVSTPAAATLKVGGSADAGLNASWTLDPSAAPLFDKGGAAANALLYLDSRPTAASRFYLETALTQDLDKGTFAKIREMFLDASLNGQLLFRVGKQRIAWGVGTWFSPADVLSLESIDLNDTGKKREGPFALKMDLPLGLHSLTLYTVLPESPGVRGAAFAPRAEFLLGGFEVALAGYWRPDLSLRPRGIVLTTGALGPLTLNAEGVALWGSDRRWVTRLKDGTLKLRTEENALYVQGALGSSWTWINGEQDLSLSAQGQYFYDGTGYEDPSILTEESGAVRKMVNAGSLNTTDLANPGRHYGAGNLVIGKLFADTVSFGTSGWINLSDGSFRLTPSLTVKPLPLTTLRVQTSWDEGAKGRQYSPSGRLLTPSLRLSLFEVTTIEVQLPREMNTGKTTLKASINFSISGL